MRRTHGFTLHEVLITIIIIGVLAAITLPQYGRTIEIGRRRSADDILLTIYAGERVHWTRNNFFFGPLGPGNDWSPIYMDDPNAVSGPVSFTITSNGLTGAAAAFTATALYDPDGDGLGPVRTITQTGGLPGGTWNP